MTGEVALSGRKSKSVYACSTTGAVNCLHCMGEAGTGPFPHEIAFAGESLGLRDCSPSWHLNC